MITPIDNEKRPREWRKFIVYDFEWVPGKFQDDGTMPIRLCGVYDKERGYRCYRGVDSFLNGELTYSNRGKWFYAHAGGLADFQFVLEKLVKRGYKIKASCSGSSLIIVKVRKSKHVWYFVDSYWLLRDSLRNIGKWVGIAKGNEELSEEFYRDAPIEVLRDYNETDCVILHRAIENFEEALWDLGGVLKMTIASCGMELFRRRFLKSSIKTTAAGNAIGRQAYFASRVEVFNKECFDSWYYDINSSFPYAMTFGVPGDMIKHVNGGEIEDFNKIFFSDVLIDVPEDKIPTTPVRLSGRLFFPFGAWRTWLSSIDIELLLKMGGKVKRVYETVYFEERDDLRDYATTLYDLRARSTGFMTIACKYAMNSLYGKFGESPEKDSIEIGVPRPKSGDYTAVWPGCYMISKIVPVPHEHVPISAHITAIGRRTLYEYMSETSEVHYCDTDGFSTEDFLGFGKDGVLGELKLEKRIKHGEFITQKVYRLDGDEYKKGEWVPLGDKGVRAKGFSRIDSQKFDEIVAGNPVEYRRMMRSKELLRKGMTTPIEKTFPKRLTGENIEKRFFYSDGYSRPWHIQELMSAGLKKEP